MVLKIVVAVASVSNPIWDEHMKNLWFPLALRMFPIDSLHILYGGCKKKLKTGWWFGTCFIIFPYIGNTNPN